MGATFIYPTVKRVTSKFRTPSRPNHHGVDFAEPGYQEVKAAADGHVVKSYLSSSYGHCIIVEHVINGDVWQTLYAHLKERKVFLGDKVKQGQVIGVMGNTGDSTGQHLHFELHKGRWNINKTDAVDPLKYLDKDLYPETASKTDTFKVVTTLDGYYTATDAKTRKNKKTTVKPGVYFVFNTADGMVNVTSKKGVPGSWINPADNKVNGKEDFKLGQKVKVKKKASKYATGETIPSWVKGKKYTIQQVKSDRVLLKEIISWVYKKDVE
jgi:hypothetical protein